MNDGHGAWRDSVSHSSLLFSGALLNELVFEQGVHDDRDLYILKYEFDHKKGHCVLNSYYLREDIQIITPSSRFPVSLSFLTGSKDNDEIAFHYPWLELETVRSLRNNGIDDLAVYAFLTHYPDMALFLDKPLILLLATKFRKTFDSIPAELHSNYRQWLAKLFGLEQRLTKGMVRLLSRLNFGKETVFEASRLVILSFNKLRRFIPDKGVIEPENVIGLATVLKGETELAHARWLIDHPFGGKYEAEHILNIYRDCRFMLHQLGSLHIRHRLLSQPKSFEDLLALHDRLTDETYYKAIHIDPNTPLQTYGLSDTGPFRLIRTAGELTDCAERLKNCASLYVVNCIEGRYVHWEYNYAEEIALLQLEINQDLEPIPTQFSGPENHPASLYACSYLKDLLQFVADAFQKFQRQNNDGTS